MELRWTAAGMLEAAKGFRRLKAHRQLPVLKGRTSETSRGGLQRRWPDRKGHLTMTHAAPPGPDFNNH